MMEGSSPSRFDRIPDDAPTAHSPGSQYWLHDGVLYGRTSSDHVRRDASFADAAFEAIQGLVGSGRRVPMLMDARNLGWLQMSGRQRMHERADQVITRGAVLVRNGAVRAMSHAVLGFVKPRVPIGVFTDEDTAWAFLHADTDVP